MINKQRAKDHKGEKVREGALKTYFIRSREHLERVMPEIILLCEHYGARAYINLAGKDFDALQKLMLKKLAIDVSEGIIRNPRRCLNSAAGELKSRLQDGLLMLMTLTRKVLYMNGSAIYGMTRVS